MSAFTDLHAATARIAASTSAEIKAVSDKIDQLTAGTVTDEQLQELSASLNATSDALDAEAAKLAAVPPTE